jgi:predicted site-specific integrase-resolvase
MPPRSKSPSPPPKPKGVRVNTWCALNEASRTHAYELMKRGELRYYYLGKTRRILVESPDSEN